MDKFERGEVDRRFQRLQQIYHVQKRDVSVSAAHVFALEDVI